MDTLRRLTARLKAAFTKKRVLWGGGGLGLALVLLMLVPTPAHALGCSWYDLPCHAAHLLTWFFSILTALMGFILVLETDALIRVAQYNNFVAPGPTAVKVGWVVTRDLANMFFIVFLLIIAFSTVIGIEQYGYRKNLRRLLIMAIVINFSKTICGLFIDMSQVLLLSFVNGFKAAAAGNFMSAFQINKLLNLSNGDGDYTFALVLAMMFAFIMAAIAACIMLILLVMMIFRIVTLWVLIILSPIAFLTSSFPLGSENYYAKWWSMFKANLTSGPIIAFFIWLALATAQQTGGQLSGQSEGWPASTTVAQAETKAAGSFKGASIPTEAGTSDTIMSMVIVICLLLAGLKQASEQNVMGAGFAKNVRSRVEKALKSPPGLGLVKQTGYGIAGSLATRVPGLRGIGAVAKAREQDFKDARKKSIEKFTGTEEQKQKFMRPQDYAARVANMNDPKKQMDAFKSSLKDPNLVGEMFKERKNGTTDAQRIIGNLAETGKGKDIADFVDLAVSDKNLAKELKRQTPDGKQVYAEDLMSVRDKMQDFAKTDASQKGKVDAFDQKFVAQFAQMDQMLGGTPVRKRDKDGNIVKDENGNEVTRKVLEDEDLKKMVPKMTADDIGGLDEGGLERLTKFMNDSQFAKARESTTANPKKAEALKKGTETALKEARAGGDESKIAEAMKRSIHSGELTADKLALPENTQLLDIASRKMDLSGLVKNMDRSDDQRKAVDAVMSGVAKFNPDRAEKMSKNETFQEYMTQDKVAPIIEAREEAKRERGVEKERGTQEAAAQKAAKAAQDFADAVAGVGASVAKAKQDLATLKAAAGTPAPGQAPNAVQATAARKEKLIQQTEKSQGERSAALKTESDLKAQLAKVAAADKAGADRIKGALADVAKTLKKIDQDLVKNKKELDGEGGTV